MGMEVTLGADWVGPAPLGTSTASLTANQGTASSGYTYFRSDARLLAAPTPAASVGLALTRVFTVEGRVAFNMPNVRLRISNDAENAPDRAFNAERLTQYFIGAALVAHLKRLSFAGGRGLPFVSGGAAYLRQLHRGRSLVETGQVYHAGVGLKYLVKDRPTSRLRGLGFRIDARASVQRHGFGFDDHPHVWGAVGGGVLMVFAHRPRETGQ
jgi:hypothetical protein